MSMTLPVNKLVSIIRAFTYEMSCVIQSHKGYVLKYVGDKVIAFFPSSYNKLPACDNAIYCAQSMFTVVRNRINPILNQYDYPEVIVKIGIDEGENAEPTAVKREMTEIITGGETTISNSEEAREKARRSGMTKGTAGAGE